MKKRTVALLLALTLVLGVAAGGTIAWLFDKTNTITNTFAVGDIGVKLEETAADYKLIPGKTYEKDPKVTVENDFDCYLFVSFKKENDPDSYLIYTSTLTEGNGWYQDNSLPETVWYRVVNANDTTKEWNLIQGNTVKVSQDIVKRGTTTEGALVMPATGTEPKLIYQADAVQKDELYLISAWNQVAVDMGYSEVAPTT